MKKFIVLLLSLVLCLSVLSGCGGQGEKGDKGDTGAQGPQGVQGPQGPQGPQGDSGLSDELIIYQLGEIAKVYSNGMLMFTIKYASKNSSHTIFEITNVNIPHTKLDEILLIRAYNSTNVSDSAGLSIQSSDYLSLSTPNPITIQSTNSYLSYYDRLYFFSKTTSLIFAVFEI